MIWDGINIDWGQWNTFFQLILYIPLFRSYKFFKDWDCFRDRFCLFQGRYYFGLYFRIRSKNVGGNRFIFATHFFKKPIIKQVIATREQLRDNAYV